MAEPGFVVCECGRHGDYIYPGVRCVCGRIVKSQAEQDKVYAEQRRRRLAPGRDTTEEGEE